MSSPADFDLVRRNADYLYLGISADVHRLLFDILHLRELCAMAGATDPDCMGQHAIRQRQAQLAELLAP